MLKFVFFVLLLANGMLFAFHQGHLEMFFPSGREPARLGNQINADKLKLLPGPPPSAPAVAPVPAANPPPEPVVNQVAPVKAVLACTEIGNFTAAEAKRFEARWTEGQVAGKLLRRAVQESSSHMILIPPQENKEVANKKADELRKLGIADFYVIQDNNDYRWGISLGIFKTEEAARTRLAVLNQQGVRSARLIEYKVPLNRIAFQLRDLDNRARDFAEKIKSEFPRQEARACE